MATSGGQYYRKLSFREFFESLVGKGDGNDECTVKEAFENSITKSFPRSGIRHPREWKKLCCTHSEVSVMLSIFLTCGFRIERLEFTPLMSSEPRASVRWFNTALSLATGGNAGFAVKMLLLEGGVKFIHDYDPISDGALSAGKCDVYVPDTETIVSIVKRGKDMFSHVSFVLALMYGVAYNNPRLKKLRAVVTDGMRCMSASIQGNVLHLTMDPLDIVGEDGKTDIDGCTRLLRFVRDRGVACE